MACVALTSLMATIELEFLQPNPRVRVSPHDRPPLISFLANLYGLLQAEIQKDSNGDGGTARDFEIQIRDFALKAEDDIEIQLSDILLAQDTTEGGQKALHQTFREATKNARELLEIITREKESDMGSVVALTILITKFEYYFWQFSPTASLDDKTTIKYFFTELSCLQALLLQRKPGGAVNNLETKITDFSLKTEADIEMQLTNILLAQDTKCRKKASHQLIHQTLREAAQNATQLLKKRITTQKEESSSSSSSSSCVSGGEMAAAIVALTTLITKIKYYFLKPFSTVCLHDPASIKSFFANLSSLQAFLQKESSGALKALEIQIRDFALKAEEDIEIQLNNIILMAGEDTNEKLHQTLQEATENAAELLKIINNPRNEVDDEANETQPSNHWSKLRDSKIENAFKQLPHKIVGRDDDFKLLIWQEIEIGQWIDERWLKLIVIVGMPGIGKTALATSVYTFSDVQKHFDLRCWITMPIKYNETQMLHALLGSITNTNEIKKASTLDKLAEQVRKCLKGKRFLIVLDNFWNNEAWSNIQTCFPDDRNGSHIFLTTTHFDRHSYASSFYYVHNMTLLDPDKSWDLFCNTLTIKRHMAPKFEEISRDVVEKCDGLPQLIIDVAKRLSKCSNIQQEWKKIEKELESLGILDRNALIPSYNQLPQHLKVCFLYLGVFPKRYQLLAKMLIKLWIAEGFVKPLEHKELETQAYGYLKELADRSLLLIGNRNFDGKIKTCRMHSALHSFCVVEALKEGILCAVNTQEHSGLPLKVFANSCRWLSFYSHSFDYYVSIFIFYENPEVFVPPKLLRVLSIDTCIFLQRVPLHLGDLVNLRYLSITQWFEDLDIVLSNNPNLQMLVVSNNESQIGAPTINLPSSIWEPVRLRYLELGNSYMVDPPSMVKENLHSLSWVVRPTHCRKEVYDKLPNIKKLKFFLKDDIEVTHARGSCSNPIVLDYLGYLEELEKLSISVSVGCAVTLTERFRFPSQLKKLKLSGTNISEKNLNAIAKLPLLEVLKLENSFHGAVWELSDGVFRSLRLLLLEAKKLKCWEARHDYYPLFPALEYLILRSCNSLVDIPQGFAYIWTLRSIKLENCCSTLFTSAKLIQIRLRDVYGNNTVEVKILDDPVYYESQSTDTDVSLDEDPASQPASHSQSKLTWCCYK